MVRSGQRLKLSPQVYGMLPGPGTAMQWMTMQDGGAGGKLGGRGGGEGEGGGGDGGGGGVGGSGSVYGGGDGAKAFQQSTVAK